MINELLGSIIGVFGVKERKKENEYQKKMLEALGGNKELLSKLNKSLDNVEEIVVMKKGSKAKVIDCLRMLRYKIHDDTFRVKEIDELCKILKIDTRKIYG